MSREIKIIAPSKNALQNISTLQNFSLKKCISEHGCLKIPTIKKVSRLILLKNDVELKYY